MNFIRFVSLHFFRMASKKTIWNWNILVVNPIKSKLYKMKQNKTRAKNKKQRFKSKINKLYNAYGE